MPEIKQFRGRVFEKNPDVVSRRILEDMFLIPIRDSLVDTRSLFVLDGDSAAHIWQCIDGRNDTEGILEDVLGAFEVEIASAEADLAEFLEHLLAAGLIRERI